MHDHATTGGDPVATTLACGEIAVLGRMPFSSNGTFLVEVCDGDDRLVAVYKPRRGERPLWDFPPGLHRREVAAFELDRALGWDLVPPTVHRGDGPLGEGSLQLFVEHDPDVHYFVIHGRGDHHGQLRRLCAFDLVANSTDRKAGHVLLDAAGRVRAIDNGLAFHAQVKLRTVIWDFAGEPLPDDVRGALARLGDGPLPEPLAGLLDAAEREALRHRAAALADAEAFPHDPTGRRWPWPLV